MVLKIYLTIALFITFTFYANAQENADPDFHIYLLMGQSNMAGRGEITEEFKNERHSRVLMLKEDNQWVVAQHPLHFDKPSVIGVGPGLSFGIKMAEENPGTKIGLVPTAVGGTSIDLWKPGAFDEKTKTHPYDDALVRIKEAMKSGVIKGVLWHQGESDKDPSNASQYVAKLTTLIERLRTEVNNPELPFVAGELGRFITTSENINKELAKASDKIPYTGVASSEGLVHKGDGTHFDSPSAAKLGERYARQMQRIQSQIISKGKDSQ
ncbi:protein of unknown function [Fodinibius roseus]|uniref:Sialate O-acetylesterase domain-containing protein n=1 Tax=Fodinibius roseus TaxID=1194090 RepID=A0A1M5IQN6_9BACT|nr:sialate O-acetylesterase [Fodinibius roseus]SHG30638.1 protein of unknown function [Fodinibius roseus]